MHAEERPVLLAIDDDADQLLLTTIAAEKSGAWNVITADGVDAAFRQIAARNASGEPPPDLILTDLFMPQAGGLELVRMLRARPELRHTPIVMLTTSCYFRDREEAMEFGVTAYFQKSMRFSDLVAIMRLLPAYVQEHHAAERHAEAS